MKMTNDIGANSKVERLNRWHEFTIPKRNSNFLNGTLMPSIKIELWQEDIIFFFPYVSNSNFIMEGQV